MRKEVVYAVIAGITFGLIVAFGIWRINKTLVSNKNTKITTTPTPQAETSKEFKIVLDKPENNDVVTDKNLNITGITKPSAWVTVSTDDSDYTTQSDKSGAFAQEVVLSAGVNQIKITAFETNGNKSATQVLVVYSSSFQENKVAPPSPSAVASKEAEIRLKVAQDVANAMKRPKAYIGTVTDVTDSTVQIKSPGEIKQISIGDQTTSVVNVAGENNKQVKITDIAIGDFIVAMGYINSNSVLSAQRILITDPIKEPKLDAVQAKVSSSTRKSLIVNTILDNKQNTLLPDLSTDFEILKDGKNTATKFSAINDGDTIIYINQTDSKGNDTLRSVFVVVPAPVKS